MLFDNRDSEEGSHDMNKLKDLYVNIEHDQDSE